MLTTLYLTTLSKSTLMGRTQVAAPEPGLFQWHEQIPQAAFNVSHDAVLSNILKAYNSRLRASENNVGLANIASMLEDDALFCFPYPYCKTGKQAALGVLTTLQKHTADSCMVPSLPLQAEFSGQHATFNEQYGELWAPAVTYTLKDGPSSTCMVTAAEQWTWDLSAKDSTKLSKLVVYFDEKTRLDQVATCKEGSGSPGQMAKDFGLLIGTMSYQSGESKENIRHNLQVAMNGLADVTRYPTSDPRFATGWLNSFVDDGGKTPVHFCDPYPSCYSSTKEIQGFVQYSVDNLRNGVVVQVGELMVAGNVGSAQTIYSDSSKDGSCVNSHVQWATFQLADPTAGTSGPWIESDSHSTPTADPSKPPPTVARAVPGAKGLLSSMDVFYSMDAYQHARHECVVKASQSNSDSRSYSAHRVLKGMSGHY